MKKTIKVGSGISFDVVSNGSTPIRYKNLFGEDLLTLLGSATTNDGIDMSVATDLGPRLAFIMAKQADKADMNSLSFDMFMDWVEQFEALDLTNALEDIFSVYFGDDITSVDPKKKEKDKPKEN